MEKSKTMFHLIFCTIPMTVRVGAGLGGVGRYGLRYWARGAPPTVLSTPPPPTCGRIHLTTCSSSTEMERSFFNKMTKERGH
jgi:hypothetical protein